MDNKVRRYLKIFPWSTALSMDLLFWVAIDTLFLAEVKQFSDAQIVLVNSIAIWASILLQYPVMKIIQRVGNTWSCRIGTFCYLGCALMVTFCSSFYLVVSGRILCQLAYTFIAMTHVVLQNNLELVGEREEYVRYRSQANTIYSIITMVIAMAAGFLFNYNPYLPMLCSIGLCVTSLILSFCVRDYSDYDRITKTEKTGKSKSLGYSKYVWLLLLAFAFGGALMSIGQEEGKLFIQQTLLTEFDMEKTAYLISGMVLVSRIVRVISNIVFLPIYRKMKEYASLVLNGILLLALLIMILGFVLPLPMIGRFLVMALGYALILFLRDAYTIQAQTQVLTATPHQQHQSVVANMILGRKIANAMISLAMAAVIIKIPMVWAIAGLSVLTVAQVGLVLYITRSRSADTAEVQA